MVCKRITLKKYANRPSPPYHASDCKGKVLKGNNGKNYKSVSDSRGVYTWKAGKTLKTLKITGKNVISYLTHDNGAKPWLVEDFPKDKKAILYRNTVDPVKVAEMKYIALWPSSDSKAFGDWKKGNTVLIQKSKKTFVLVYRNIREFKIIDTAVKFMSPIGNSDVPYPYLIGTENVYFLADSGSIRYVSKGDLELSKDVYDQLWCINEFKDAVPLKSNKLKETILYS